MSAKEITQPKTPAAKPPTAIPTLMTPNEAAKILKVSLSWLAKARMRGDGPPYIRVGRSIRYAEAALIQWMKSRQRCRRASSSRDRPEPRRVGSEQPLLQGHRPEAGIIVYLNTSVYINRNEVERRLGTYIEVYPRYILLTYS